MTSNNMEALRAAWLEEERAAHIKGWDFAHLTGRYEEDDRFPWDYTQAVRAHLAPQARLLDMDTGGGEFLLSLSHPYSLTSTTEGFAPNVALCRETLLPLGIDFREAADMRHLPFANDSFDLVINRHGDFDPKELRRVLKPNGLFITQQVGAQNDAELAELLLPGLPRPFPEHDLAHWEAAFRRAGFAIEQAQEAFGMIRFFDVGALVWFARIIEWEFPGFSVERCWKALCAAQERLAREGEITAHTHRFFLIAKNQK